MLSVVVSSLAEYSEVARESGTEYAVLVNRCIGVLCTRVRNKQRKVFAFLHI
jgi:hypothetical protein